MFNTESKYTLLADGDVIEKIMQGEKLLFELLMRRNNSALYKVGRAYGFNHHDTEDLMQDAHLTAYLNLKNFEGRAQYKTWLIRIMINKCLARLEKAEYKARTHTTTENTILMNGPNGYDTEKEILNNELGLVLEKCLAELPLSYRMVFILREKEGLSNAETAATLNITETNVKVRLNRSKTLLRQKIEAVYTSTPVYQFNLIYCDAIVNKVMQQLP